MELINFSSVAHGRGAVIPARFGSVLYRTAIMRIVMSIKSLPRSPCRAPPWLLKSSSHAQGKPVFMDVGVHDALSTQHRGRTSR